MGIIYNNNVEESKIYQAYGLTVYGKVNSYVWEIFNNKEENALITIRIVDVEGKDIFSMYMGNRYIFQSRIDDTMDNFLYWMVKDQPDTYTIENQIYKSLCQSDSIFNHLISNRKQKEKRQVEEEQRIAERQEEEKRQLDKIKEYCDSKGLFFYQDYTDIYLLKATTNHDRKLLAEARDNKNKMQMIIDFMEKHPEYEGVKIVKRDTMENILKYIK